MSGNARYITVEDIEMFYTGAAEHPFVLHGDLLEVMKSTGTTTTSVTGILNKVYGALVWAQLNQEANVFGMIPKTTWVRSGWRVKTAMAVSNEQTIGLSETSSLPSAVYPDIALVTASPKIQAEVFDVTDVVEALSSVSADDIWGAAHQIRAEVGTEFIKLLNQQLMHKMGEFENTSGVIQTIDRVVSKNGEAGVTSGFWNIYGLDRGTSAWANAYVDDNSGTLRDLTDKVVRNLLQNTRSRGGNTNVMLTGYDTYATLLGLYMSYVRYMPMSEAKVQFGVGGIQSAAGLDTGINVASLYGIPLVQTVDCPATSGGISYLYALDTSDPEGYGFPRLSLSILRPVEYFESRDYVLLNKFVIRGVYRIVGELTARNLYGQGKATYLK
jgi:hypothetical protein